MATAMEVIDRIDQQDCDRAVDYRELVRRFAADKASDPDEVREVLAAVGKSSQDLRRDVQSRQHRDQRQRELATIPELEAKQQELSKKISKEDENLQAAQQAYVAAVAPLREQVNHVAHQIFTTKRLERELAESCPDPQLVQRHRRLKAAIPRLRDACHATDSKVHAQQAAMDAALQRGDKKQAERYKRQLERAKAEQTTARQRLANAATESDQLYRAMIDA